MEPRRKGKRNDDSKKHRNQRDNEKEKSANPFSGTNRYSDLFTISITSPNKRAHLYRLRSVLYVKQGGMEADNRHIRAPPSFHSFLPVKCRFSSIRRMKNPDIHFTHGRLKSKLNFRESYTELSRVVVVLAVAAAVVLAVVGTGGGGDCRGGEDIGSGVIIIIIIIIIIMIDSLQKTAVLGTSHIRRKVET